MGLDWHKIETEYVTTRISQRQLAEKYGVTQSTIYAHSKADGWVKKREEYLVSTKSMVVQKAQEKILSDVEIGTAHLNEAWLNLCSYVARKSKEELEPIDAQRIANIYQTIRPADKAEEVEMAGIVILPKQEVVKGGD